MGLDVDRMRRFYEAFGRVDDVLPEEVKMLMFPQEDGSVFMRVENVGDYFESGKEISIDVVKVSYFGVFLVM
jgi:hypothetical protein